MQLPRWLAFLVMLASGGVMAAALLLLASCAAAPAAPARVTGAASTALGDDLIVVAFDDLPQAPSAAGASPGAGYRLAGGYAGSDASLALADELAREHRLTELAAWTIAPLRWRCLLYRAPPGSDRQAVIQALTGDGRVRLAQPLNQFETQGDTSYNDPYLGLQTGFAAIAAAPAHRYTQGEHARVAVIDTGVDAAHADLAGRLTGARDFVGGAVTPEERHGTEVAGILAATAHNGIGIVGVAPLARLLPLRACWARPGGASCNSFTLAQALGAAIAADVDVINLSLGGPGDALLERLTTYALDHGIIVVGAVPPSGRLEGFPAGVSGVIAAACAEAGHPAPGALAAPCHDILTLTPGGHYDFASGSSMAAAHVSGAIALLRSVDHTLSAPRAMSLLNRSANPPASINVCSAVRLLRAKATDSCVEDPMLGH